MIALVTGGAASGKSAFAESLALALPGPHVYLATMRHGDAEVESRIGRHRAARAGKGFATVELFGGNPANLPDAATILVEDLGNLVLNWERGRDRVCERERDRVCFPPCGNRTSLETLFARWETDPVPFPLVPFPLVPFPLVPFPLASARNAVYVGNEIGCDGVRYDGFTRDFTRRLGALSCEIAAAADLVVEVVAGVPFVVKGELPCRC